MPEDDGPGAAEQVEVPSEEMIGQTLMLAARGGPYGQRAIDVLAEVAAAYPAVVGRGVRCALEGLVRGAWQGGWQPADLDAVARGRLDPAGRRMLLGVIGSEHQRYTPTTIDPRWQNQLDRLDLRTGDEDPATGVRVAVGIAGLLMTLPVLPRLLPLPGSHLRTSRPGPSRGVDDRALARIRGLLAKAESTEFPEEAEALSEKAQTLMARFSLDRAMVDAGPEADLSGGPGALRLWLEAPYLSAKSDLVSEVAAANRCRSIAYDKLGLVTIVGAEVDLRLTEMLATSLLVQANRAMVAAGPQSGCYGGSTTRSFRQSFLVSYGVRIGERLRTVAAAVVDEAGPEQLLPVLAARDRQVEERFAELFPNTVSRLTRVSNGAGWAAGRAAADVAALDVRRNLGH